MSETNRQLAREWLTRRFGSLDNDEDEEDLDTLTVLLDSARGRANEIPTGGAGGVREREGAHLQH